MTIDEKIRPKEMMMDGVFSSEAIDSSGEVVSLEGMDISTMEEGYGTANFEHQGDDSGGFGRETVGKIVYVHKIFKASDCEDDRQRKYWADLKGIPFLYGVVRLYDGAGHEGAKALAAQVRDAEAHGEPIIVRYSIEGTTLEKEGNRIKSSLAKRVALTLKPCNRTCVSGVLADPNAPEGFNKSLPDEVGYSRLGGDVEVECNPLMKDEEGGLHMRLMAAALTGSMIRKALEAGTTAGAPSSLTGGAALQREHIVGRIANQAKAALRDWGAKKFEKSSFIQFAKARMPEVSDEFLQHFADAAEHVTLRKADPKPRAPKVAKPAAAPAKSPPASSLKTAMKAVAAKAVAKRKPHPVLEEIADEDENLPDEIIPAKGGHKRNLAVVTRRGVSGKVNAGMVRPEFDPVKGVLHTPAGSLPAYLPKHDGPASAAEYDRILKSPEIQDAMQKAMENWHTVHKLNKEGRLPEECVSNAVMFSMLSPTKPVPTQEIQMARLNDAMDVTGLDPRNPGFRDIMEPWQNLDSPTELPHTSRQDFANNPAYWQGNQIGTTTDANGVIQGKPSPTTGRYPGELLSISPLAEDFMSRAEEYHKLHPFLMNLVKEHRHDGFTAISKLMNVKQAGNNWANTRRAAIKRGAPDPGPYTGVKPMGLKVKTGLYAYGMLGGGNSVVPDTHFIRHTFGLDLHKDADTIEYIKHMLWRPTNMGNIMAPLNQWYLKNHPSVQHMLQNPKFAHMFDKPEDSLFGSFWQHWVTIAPHEKFLGLPNETQQSGTTHAPFWDTIRPHVERALSGNGGEIEPGSDMEMSEAGDVDQTVPLRTAAVMQQYVRDFGEVPALMMYHRFLVPHLLKAAEHRERFGRDMEFLAKARQIEAGIIELRKNVRDVLEGTPPHPPIHQVQLQIGDRLHPAGRYMVHDGQVHHLEDYHGLLHSMVPEGKITDVTASRLHGLEFAPHIVVSPHEMPHAAGPQPDGLRGIQISAAPPPQRPPVFEYQRAGMSQPHVVEFGQHGAAIDGRKLDDAELELVLQNVEHGLATMRYRSGAVNASHLDDLAKAEPGQDVGDVLQRFRDLVARGLADPEDERILTRHVYGDLMNPDVGNKYAWEKFRTQGRPGVYASIDLNDFKHINDTHGHQAGDDAIRAASGALRDAADKVGTGRLFRSGGDEFVAHFPSMEEASRFVRHARGNFDALPPINGVHKQSFSIGLGPDYHSADAVALPAAKARKKDPVSGARAFAPGHVPHLVHSVVPGASGPMALPDERPPAQHLVPAAGASAS